ncbi:MAG: bifunctional nicotinamide mononucleotide adenylyltransferase/ADP-ribose pyrophosphatase [Firmicutes bacterium ADurb.Bin182]|nr:MAG: bifunctional nicotinamide mononucleotide adenylyltransferase/ADP-ribose pyrophosphatase [Firmicutes bacterium ADurb.Bin182]
MHFDEPRNKKGQTLSEFLKGYDENKYRRPSVTADIAVFTLLRTNKGFKIGTLLIKRGDHPFIGEWALPGGFVGIDEDIEAAAARELYEETGLTGLPLRQCGTFGKPDRDPRTRVITTAFYAIAPCWTLFPRAGDDAADADIFALDVKLLCKCASAKTFRVTLSGKQTLAFKAQIRQDFFGPYPSFHERGDLASDHSHVLFSAIYALLGQPRRRIARLLSQGKPKLMQKAVNALIRLEF